MTLWVLLLVTLQSCGRGVAAHDPIDPHVRLAISRRPDDAPRGRSRRSASSTASRVSRSTSCGSALALTGPRQWSSPGPEGRGRACRKLAERVKAQAVAVRAALEGPAWTTARSAFTRRCGRWVRPRCPRRRRVRGAFQLIDDHSRYALASHTAAGETAKDAIAVFDEAVAAHGVPQRPPPESSTSTRCSARSMPSTRSHRSSSPATATSPATRSSSPTSTARSSPTPPDPLPASAAYRQRSTRQKTADEPGRVADALTPQPSPMS